MKMFRTPPGVVSCRVGPADLPPLQPPPPNFEKIQQMYNKVRPYVPSEFASDPLYAAPTAEEKRHAKEATQAQENEDRANVSKASPAQSKTGTRSRKRAKKET
ncbi:uncharacterized protein PITG_06275 [Phytophthora infestans T30-4]|uniref:Uncharacterized protein n=1 Tax=Phytophthora infestans (strain T30-4) TaxID=403677 RepID=D0N4H5_PHYIT|nr:uncharacterized protein PITG_06275 [Phytophthora infestans T30-4]EEY69783.1 hypothetical protein PITG_06275 [Phytophthora infestans T30-4]|eukprot:XP_002998430.1 hypothetical protein PITG_06275 [Phytophthora infestans T30-4]